MRLLLDKKECPRCGGSGTMPFRVANGICFRCNGSGKELTRAGHVANTRYRAWRETHLRQPVSDLKPGMRIRVPRQLVSPDGQFADWRRAATVVKVGPNTHASDGALPRVWVRHNGPLGWLAYDAQLQALEVSLEGPYFDRAPTQDELRAVAPTLGAGATLVE